MGRFEDMVEGLREDIEVPEMVWTKYTDTLSHLPDQKGQASRKSVKRIKWPVAAAAALFVGVAGISAAAYMQWSKALEEHLRITEEQHKELEESRIASAVGQSVTQNGVTVTMEESIVDNNCAHLAFKVEGYELEAGKEPGFGQTAVQVDGKGDFPGGWSSSFYDGLVAGNDGKAVFADGTPLTDDSQISYAMEDGSLEYLVTMMSSEKGYFIGKPIHVELKDLGTYSGKEEDVLPDVEGTWSFDWTMEGSGERKTCEMDAALGDSGASVVKAELSPVSISVVYDFPMQEETELGIDETTGETFIHTTYAEPPFFTGVRLKDGTLYTGIFNGGSTRYTDDEFETMTILSRAIDVDQVESLAFVKSYPEGEQPLSEENLYFVPVE